MRSHLPALALLLAAPTLATAQAVQFPPRAAYQHNAQIVITIPPPEFGPGQSMVQLYNWLWQPDPRDRDVRHEIWVRAEWNGDSPPQYAGDIRLAIVIHTVSRNPRPGEERDRRPITLAGREMELVVDQRQPIYLRPGESSTGGMGPGPDSPMVETWVDIPYAIHPEDLLALTQTASLTVRVGELSITSSDRRTFQALLDFASRLRPER